eukprot:125983_1
MNRNPKNKHLKRINAPNSWLLDKLSGVWAPRPSPGPHKLRECLPIIIMLRNRLKYALTAREVKMIVMGRHIRVDGKVRTDTKFPCGFQDVVTINRTGEHFRLIYDVKGRFHLHRIPVAEASWKLLKVKKKALGARGIPYIVTHDGRTIPYPDPNIYVNDTIKYDFLLGKIVQVCHFRVGGICMLTGGRNVGRVGVIEKLEKHPGAFDIVHVRDAKDHKFATRKDNIFILGSGAKPLITLPKTKGIKYTIIEDREFRLKRQSNPVHNQNNRKELSGKGTLLPPQTMQLRKQTKEKKKLLKILRDQERKAMRNRPKPKKAKKADK